VGDFIKRYKKGIETRNNIINASKSLFYLQGYKNTTVQKIADLASVNLGLLSYYFKTKNNIIKIIFTDFLDNIDNLISNCNVSDENLIVFYMVKERIAYNIIFKNQNNLRFYKEIINNNIVMKIMEEYTLSNFIKINEVKNLKIDINHIKCYSALEVGGSYNILKKYFLGSIEISYDDMVNILIGCTPRLFGMDNDSIRSFIIESKKISESINYSSIKFLI
jgi:hypothetical protein